MPILHRRLGEKLTIRLARDLDPAPPIGEIFEQDRRIRHKRGPTWHWTRKQPEVSPGQTVRGFIDEHVDDRLESRLLVHTGGFGFLVGLGRFGSASERWCRA